MVQMKTSKLIQSNIFLCVCACIGYYIFQLYNFHLLFKNKLPHNLDFLFFLFFQKTLYLLVKAFL